MASQILTTTEGTKHGESNLNYNRRN